MAGSVTLKGQTLHLKGDFLKVGAAAPDCELIGADLKSVKLSSFKGKHTILLSIPSLDTPVCSSEAHKFNLALDKYGERLNIVCVSMDLPFAQSRWCAADGAKNIKFLSDYKTHEFGEKYGVFIEDLGLLARAVFILDPSMKVLQAHLVKEVSDEPDYNLINEQIQQLVAHT